MKLVVLATLQTEWEQRLRAEALTRRVFSMVRFSGNDLSIDDVAKIVKDEPGRDDRASDVAVRTGVIGKERNVQQVINLINVNRLVEQMAYLTSKFKQGDYGEKDLAQINSLIGERLVTAEDLGSFRTKNYLDQFTEDFPLPVEIPFQVEDLFNWFRSSGRNEIHPILKAGTMFFELLRISPFKENNLLTAISFYELILASEGYAFRKLLPLAEEVLKNGDSLKTALSSVERNSGDLTIWLEFLNRCFSDSAEKIMTKVMNLVGEAPIFKSEGGRAISLTERQIAIMEEITLKNEMTIKEIRNILPMVSDDTILRDLKDLISKKLIRKKGKTKGAVYVMGKVRSFK